MASSIVEETTTRIGGRSAHTRPAGLPRLIGARIARSLWLRERGMAELRWAVAATGQEPIDGRLIPLTISAGVASLVDEPDGRALFRAADSALLAAKRAGRDRVAQI